MKFGSDGIICDLTFIQKGILVFGREFSDKYQNFLVKMVKARNEDEKQN